MQCSQCSADKAPTEFYAGQKICKVCRCAQVREYRVKNIDKVRAYDVARSKTPARVAHITRTAQEWANGNPKGRAAQVAVGNALRDGRLQRWPCEVCGEKAHAHHPHYGAPLLVTWLCPPHHKQAHQITSTATTRNHP